MYPYLINTDNAAMESSSHDFKVKAVHAKTIFDTFSRQASDVQLYWGVSRLEYKTLFIIQYSQTFNWDKIGTTVKFIRTVYGLGILIPTLYYHGMLKIINLNLKHTPYWLTQRKKLKLAQLQ